MGGRKGRDGLYPASDCIKITGHYGKLTLGLKKRVYEYSDYVTGHLGKL